MVYPVGLSATLSNHLQDIKTESKKVSFDDGYVCFKVFTIIHGCFNDVSTTEVSKNVFPLTMLPLENVSPGGSVPDRCVSSLSIP